MKILNKCLPFAISCSFLGALAACDTSNVASNSASDSKSVLFDLNDVSFLLPKDNGLSFATQTAEGPLVSESVFKQAEGMLVVNKLDDYSAFQLVGVRIDNCAKLLPEHPCQAQIRLVFQSADNGFHMIFNIDDATAIGMYQDFYDLKKSASPATTVGNLGIHPILAKESMKGPFSERFKKLLVKYAVPSRYDRIAVMGTGAPWEFAASEPVKNGIVKRTAIPCQKPDQPTNILDLSPLSGMVQRHSMTGCDDFNVEGIAFARKSGGRIPFMNNPQSIAAVKTVNPEKTFFGSTTCGNCHLALRNADWSSPDFDEAKTTWAKDVAYMSPTDVTQGKPITESGTLGGYATRAFGYGERFDEPEISLFTINDTMRVAHELNELIHSGKIK